MTATRRPPISLMVARLEHAARRGVERVRVVESSLLGEEDILRQEFAPEALEVAAQNFFAVGKFPMTGHRLDAEQIGGLDHVGALHGIGEAGALPQIAAVQQQRIAGRQRRRVAGRSMS